MEKAMRVEADVMVKVVTNSGFDYVKRSLLTHFIRVGYVVALA